MTIEPVAFRCRTCNRLMKQRRCFLHAANGDENEPLYTESQLAELRVANREFIEAQVQLLDKLERIRDLVPVQPYPSPSTEPLDWAVEVRTILREALGDA